jgi:lipopolysaccharide transport system ATP-binding protein
MSEVAIAVHNLTKVYELYEKPIDRLKEALNPFGTIYHRDYYALNDVSFEVRKGETVGIIGKNGAGKSTLLKIITGVLPPTHGQISVDGKISSLLELGTGFNPEMTGIENVYLNGTIMGYTKKEVDAKIDNIISFADIGSFVHQPVKMYSTGMFARLAFAVAINVDPDVLIVDEALSVGDASFQRKCFARMEDFRRTGKTILFVSHSEGSIINLCSRAILIDEGEKIFESLPKFVVGNYLKLLSLSGQEYCEYKNYLKSNANDQYTDKHQTNWSLNISPNQLCEADYGDEEFIDSLTPTSTIEYDSKGVKLGNVQLSTLQGKRVNVIKHGKRYLYTYEAEFFESMFSVSFGMLVKTLDGIELGGGIFPHETDRFPYIPSGARLRIVWEFKCIFEDGVYCTNCGVLSRVGGTQDYSHRILDSYMFRVISRPKRITTSYVDLDLNPSIVEM